MLLCGILVLGRRLLVTPLVCRKMKIRLLNIDEHSEAINTLFSLKNQLYLLDLKVYRWKWIIIILHNCLQNFMVCCLSSKFNYFNVLKEGHPQMWYEYLLYPFKKVPKIKLDICISLFNKIQSDAMLKKKQSKIFTATENHKYAVNKLNELRNNFLHFIPKDWSIEISGLPNLTLNILEIIEFLAFESDNYEWNNDSEKATCETVINDIKNKLILLKESYES